MKTFIMIFALMLAGCSGQTDTKPELVQAEQTEATNLQAEVSDRTIEDQFKSLLCKVLEDTKQDKITWSAVTTVKFATYIEKEYLSISEDGAYLNIRVGHPTLDILLCSECQEQLFNYLFNKYNKNSEERKKEEFNKFFDKVLR